MNRSRRLQFGIRALLAWTCALASALALGRIKERYEPWLGGGGQMAILGVLVVVGLLVGVPTGRAVHPRYGPILGGLLGVALMFLAFMVCITLV